MEEKKSHGKGVASLVLGIIALLFTFLGYGSIIGLILGIIGIALAKAQKKVEPCGVATAGLVMSIISTVFCGIAFIACVACVGALGSIGSSY